MTPEWICRELSALKKDALFRCLTETGSATGARVLVDGRELVNFSSNDYLGLANDPRLIKAANDAARRWGVGAGASRLITGTLGIHTQLERKLAELKSTERALLFSTGYQANIGILTTLASEGVILSDELNHSSIVDGCRLARAETVIYRHCDLTDLAEKMEVHSAVPRKLIVTDGVFSMDGDLAPLPGIVELARRHDALVVVDDAHGTGVMAGGRGTAHHFGLAEEVDVHMGTFGKALGSFGAFVASSRAICELLVNRARSLIYTTAPPPPSVGAALSALEVMEEEPERLAKLARNAQQLRTGLRGFGYEVPDHPTPIVPLILGSNEKTLGWGSALLERGFWVHPIRPPTVAEGSARLRITLCATHTSEEVAGLLAALEELAKR